MTEVGAVIFDVAVDGRFEFIAVCKAFVGVDGGWIDDEGSDGVLHLIGLISGM